MFTRARLRIAGLYVALFGLIIVLVAGSLVLLASRDARQTADLELRLRAEGLAGEMLRNGVASPTPPRRDDRKSDDRKNEDEHEHENGDRDLERAGVLSYIVSITSGQVAANKPTTIAELPDEAAAQRTLAAGSGQFSTLALREGRVRLYSLPVEQNGTVVAVVQVVRSQSFVDATLHRLLAGLFGSALLGLAAAGLAGYWLAGRTLRPIADAFQRQRDFVADASHELRTPLTVIQGNIDHMRRHPERPVGAYDDVMADVAAETERLSRLVTGLLTLARLDDGQVQLHWSPVDLTAIARGLVREMAPLAHAKGLELRSEIQPGVVIQGDRDRLRELGLILLDNAVRYTTSGAISLELRSDPANVELRVVDTGPGMEPASLSRIFDRFYRTPAARSSETSGTGLGLAIAHWIVEAHGGRITVTSAVGKGSSFTVILPHRAPRHGTDSAGVRA